MKNSSKSIRNRPVYNKPDDVKPVNRKPIYLTSRSSYDKPIYDRYNRQDHSRDE